MKNIKVASVCSAVVKALRAGEYDIMRKLEIHKS